MGSRDEVEKHFNVARALDIRFKEVLAKSEFSTESEFFRFHMRQFVNGSESKQKIPWREESLTKKKKKT